MRSAQRPLRVLHLSTYASGGGAARAAQALHQAQIERGMDSRLLSASGSRFTIARQLDRNLWRLQRSPVKTWRSPARFGSLSADVINQSDVDIVNLHWVTDGFLSIEQIGRITKPIVWSLYDMWPFSGTEHYGTDDPQARWRSGYTKANRPRNESRFDLDRWTWQQKRKHWSKPMHIVAASTWMQDRVSASALMCKWPITRIPHVVDTNVFSPTQRDVARTKLDLPLKSPIVLFLASAGIDDSRKGFDLLKAAWPQVQAHLPEAQIMVVGPETPDSVLAHGLPIIWRGAITDDATLALHYSAAEVVAVPSREDNMPLSAIEAQACACPVVAFDIGGLPDIVHHNQTGYLANLENTVEFARGLISALHPSTRSEDWNEQARARATTTWSTNVVASQYHELYRGLLK